MSLTSSLACPGSGSYADMLSGPVLSCRPAGVPFCLPGSPVDRSSPSIGGADPKTEAGLLRGLSHGLAQLGQLDGHEHLEASSGGCAAQRGNVGVVAAVTART